MIDFLHVHDDDDHADEDDYKDDIVRGNASRKILTFHVNCSNLRFLLAQYPQALESAHAALIIREQAASQKAKAFAKKVCTPFHSMSCARHAVFFDVHVK